VGGDFSHNPSGRGNFIDVRRKILRGYATASRLEFSLPLNEIA
jgi:hypothetical protein